MARMTSFSNPIAELAGAYQKTWTAPWSSLPTMNTALMVVYLLPTGRFLYVGCWEGFETSAAAGVWSVEGDLVHLGGKGHVHADTLRVPEPRPFVLTFVLHNNEHARELRAMVGDWSLLSIDRGAPLTYLGRVGVSFRGLCSGFPEAWEAVDPWTQHLLDGVERLGS
jgi:hypothetical protein